MSGTCRADVVIVGGAAMGAAIGYFLKAVMGSALSVLVIERDPSFRRAATALSAASIRQQFSTPESIRLSRFGFEFLSGLPGRHGPDADTGLKEAGYLILATPAGQAASRGDVALQRAEGADVAWLSPTELERRFPWLSLEDLAGGALGLSGEGWFDAHALLATLRREAERAGAILLTGEVTGIDLAGGRVAAVRLGDGRSISCGVLVNAAGPAAGGLSRLADRPLPVEPRKRTVFVLDCPAAPHPMPLVADPSGLWLRPEGGHFLAGYSPPPDQDRPADPEDFEPDWESFEEVLWPLLARRIPAFDTLKVLRAWAGHYDMNGLDRNGIVGPDPEIENFLYATGFSGHGLQHAPGVGRAVAEWLAFGEYRSIDLSPLGYHRIAAGRPLNERAVI